MIRQDLTGLDETGQDWTRLDRIGQIGQDWTKMDRIGQEWTKLSNN